MYNSYKAISFEAKDRLPFINWNNVKSNTNDKKHIRKIYKEMLI